MLRSLKYPRRGSGRITGSAKLHLVSNLGNVAGRSSTDHLNFNICATQYSRSIDQMGATISSTKAHIIEVGSVSKTYRLSPTNSVKEVGLDVGAISSVVSPAGNDGARGKTIGLRANVDLANISKLILCPYIQGVDHRPFTKHVQLVFIELRRVLHVDHRLSVLVGVNCHPEGAVIDIGIAFKGKRCLAIVWVGFDIEEPVISAAGGRIGFVPGVGYESPPDGASIKRGHV